MIVCVCEHRLATWRHGVVAAFERWPVRYEVGSSQASAALFAMIHISGCTGPGSIRLCRPISFRGRHSDGILQSDADGDLV